MAETRLTFKELDRKLSELEPKLAVRELRSAARVAANIVKKDAQRRAPVKTGKLRRSLRVRTRIDKVRKVIIASITNAPETFYGLFIEFGTSKLSARPFMRPAAESQAQAALRKMQDHLKRRLDKLVT